MSAAGVAAVYRQNPVLMFADPGQDRRLAVHLQAGNIARPRNRPFAATTADPRAGRRRGAHNRSARDIIARPSLEARLDILRRHHPELQVRLIEGAGHWVMYEAADRFNATFLDLLAAPG
jgi:pimeloyl-ACP methyl ester carboxylesterase